MVSSIPEDSDHAPFTDLEQKAFVVDRVGSCLTSRLITMQKLVVVFHICVRACMYRSQKFGGRWAPPLWDVDVTA